MNSKGTFVKRFDTSNDTISCSLSTFRSLIFEMNSAVLLIEYSDFVKGANNFAKCCDVLYVAVPIFDIIGLIGNLLMSLHPGSTLWSFAVP